MASRVDSPTDDEPRSPKSSRKSNHANKFNSSSTLPSSPKNTYKVSKAGLRPMRVRIVMVGAEKTGKSCLIKRYCEKRFVLKYMATIGIDYGATKIFVDKREVSVHIFDTSGNPLFKDIRNEFYQDAHGILLVFDVTRRDTFYALPKLLHEIRSELLQRATGEDITGRSSTKTVVVCANKMDANNASLENRVDETEAKLWAELHGFSYCETSASSGQGVGEMFQTFFSQIVKQQLEISASGTMPRTPASARRVQLASSSSSLSVTSGTLPRELSQGVTATPEQSAVMKLIKLGQVEQLFPLNSTRDEINRIYRKLAILLHPDKTGLPGADEAFKLLGIARRNLLANST